LPAKLILIKPVTIPKALSREGDLVVIPRREYEQLLALKKIREFQPTSRQQAALKRAERNLRKGKSLSYDAVARALDLADLSRCH
jgi:protein involved in polysaccharide export with SLBB domain